MNLNDIYPLNDLKRSKTAKLRYVYPPKLLCRVEAHQKVRGIVLAATSARNFFRRKVHFGSISSLRIFTDNRKKKSGGHGDGNNGPAFIP